MQIVDTRHSVHRLALVTSAFSFLLLSAVAAHADTGDAWPREITTQGNTVLIYQPQVDRLEGNELYSRAAVSITPAGGGEPTFGAIWLETRLDTDLDSRTASLDDVRVPRVRFSDATPEQEEQLTELLTTEIPKWQLEISLDRLVALLELADIEAQNAQGFDDSAPIILFAEEPSVLVTIDGAPQLRKLEGSDLEHVVNTPFLLVEDPQKKGSYYLYAGADTWYRASAVEGPWRVATEVPDAIRQVEPDEEPVDAEEAKAAEEGPDTPPAIVVATEPTELIVTDGAPNYQPLADGKLLVVTNTDSDVLREVASQRLFVLLSGRWFARKGAEGAWEFVPSDGLPESFAAIDPDSDYGYLLTWVAGTEMAEEARLDSHVPQTAAIKRDATITVTYDGDPSFEAIDGTSLAFAANTESQVIQDGATFYCAEDAVWYLADNPKGPWRVATEVPEEIQKIPPESPVYNTKYIYIYDTTPEVVYVGYYPGYVHSYHYHGCLVYGTGWYYRPWWGPRLYYPRYRTWGFHVRWNPVYGWSLGFSYSTGRFTFSIGRGGVYGRGWWGPVGWRGYRRGYHRGWHHGYRAGARAGYRAGYNTAQRNTRQNLYQRPDNVARVAPATDRSATRPTVAQDRPNNVYTDRDGNVYRRDNDGSWQSREGGRWENTDPSGGQRDRPSTADRQQPESGRPSQGSAGQRPSTGSPSDRSGYPGSGGSSLNQDYGARQKGSQRTRSYGGGASRGGGSRGGRRR